MKQKLLRNIGESFFNMISSLMVSHKIQWTPEEFTKHFKRQTSLEKTQITL